MSDPVLTIDEVAVALRCSPSTVKNRIRDGEIRTVKIGALRRIRLSDLTSFVKDLPVADPGKPPTRHDNAVTT